MLAYTVSFIYSFSFDSVYPLTHAQCPQDLSALPRIQYMFTFIIVAYIEPNYTRCTDIGLGNRNILADASLFTARPQSHHS